MSDFYARKDCEGGRSWICKQCHNARTLAWQKSPSGRDASRAAANKFASSEKGVAWRAAYLKTPKGQEIIRANARRQIDSGMAAAHLAVKRAVEKGILVKTGVCAGCGAKAKTDMHHTHGYAREHRLTVVEICRACHRKEHDHV